MKIVRIHIPEDELEAMQWVYCERCHRKLERLYLELKSSVEIQCKCSHLNQFGVDQEQVALLPDGIGGWIKQLASTTIE